MSKNQKRQHREIPWSKISTAWNRGDSYEKMGKTFGYFDSKADDSTKPMRAVVSRGLSEGKLEPREGMRAIGIGKKAPKAKLAKAAKTAKVVSKGKPGRPAVMGKKILIQLDAEGKLIRIEGEKPKSLVPAQKFVGAAIGVLNQLGYDVTKKEVAAAPASSLPADMPQAPAQEDVQVATEVATPETPVQNEEHVETSAA